MSTPLSNMNSEENPSTPLPEPNLNFTAQVHSLLNSVTPRTPDNNVPDAPDGLLDTGSYKVKKQVHQAQMTEMNKPMM